VHPDQQHLQQHLQQSAGLHPDPAVIKVRSCIFQALRNNSPIKSHEYLPCIPLFIWLRVPTGPLWLVLAPAPDSSLKASFIRVIRPFSPIFFDYALLRIYRIIEWLWRWCKLDRLFLLVHGWNFYGIRGTRWRWIVIRFQVDSR
jgi:hypothetical protein